MGLKALELENAVQQSREQLALHKASLESGGALDRLNYIPKYCIGNSQSNGSRALIMEHDDGFFYPVLTDKLQGLDFGIEDDGGIAIVVLADGSLRASVRTSSYPDLMKE
ncbi:MAG: hypothetical protein ACPGWR_00895 [Ardenticatenaceae bacterium]